MARRRRVVVLVAVSADGFIARQDGAVDWLDRPQTAGDYGMRAFLRSIDTILWGRKTYEMALSFGDEGTRFAPHVRNFVFTRGSLARLLPGFERVHEPLAEFMARLRAQPGKDVWVMGGAELIGTLLDAGQVDAFVLNVIPTLIGAGIPLLSPRARTVALKLESAKAFADGVVRLRYAVEHPRRRATERKPGPGTTGRRRRAR